MAANRKLSLVPQQLVVLWLDGNVWNAHRAIIKEDEMRTGMWQKMILKPANKDFTIHPSIFS
jgi:tRNA-binding EMAP/Myf-like protein